MTANLEVGEDAWSWTKQFSVQATQLEIHDIQQTGGTLAPGATGSVNISMVNTGGVPSGNIMLRPLDHEHVSYNAAGFTLPAAGVDEVVVAGVNLGMTFDDQLFQGDQMGEPRWVVGFEIGDALG